jgi:hypothetical protein
MSVLTRDRSLYGWEGWKVEDQEGQNEIEQVVTGENVAARPLPMIGAKTSHRTYRTGSASYQIPYPRCQRR